MMNTQPIQSNRAWSLHRLRLWMLVICATLLLLAACGQPDTAGYNTAPTSGVLTTIGPAAPTTTAAATPTSQAGSFVRAMHLVNATTGWVLTDARLLWTTNEGHDWTDLALPQQVQAAQVRSVFFLDDRHGWLVFTQPAAATPHQPGIAIVQTNDGGTSWSESIPLSAQINDPSPATGEVSIDFVDVQYGWIMFRLESSSAFSFGALLRTQDGGRSWTQVAAPSGELVRFLTPTDGWMTNTVEGKLYVTHDSGQSWQSQDLPLPPSDGRMAPTYALPTFTSREYGVLPVTLTGEHINMVFFVTHDGGQSWTRAATEPIPGRVEQGQKMRIAVLDPNTWLIPLPNGTIHMTRDVGAHWQDTPTNLPAGILDLSFATSTHGWAQRSTNACAQFKAQCSAQTEVLATGDAGRTWTSVLSLSGTH